LYAEQASPSSQQLLRHEKTKTDPNSIGVEQEESCSKCKDGISVGKI